MSCFRHLATSLCRSGTQRARSRYRRRVMDYYVPEETEVLLRNRVNECKNLGLLLDKYIPTSVFEKPDKNDKNKGKTPWLTRILEPTSTNDTGKKQNKHIDTELARHVYQR